MLNKSAYMQTNRCIMKNARKFLLVLALFCLTISVSAQEPPPPPASHGETGNQGPADAPIDGGLGILLALGAAYGGYRIYKYKKDQKEEENPVS
jgi:hypothetical protein